MIIGDLRNTVWHIGLSSSSRGSPTIGNEELFKLVDKWLKLGKVLYT